jgi:disulfide bond formation protein DsbB
MSPSLARSLNALGLLAVGAVLLVAFGFQFAFGELPCPLCILQRSAFVAVLAGLALNLRFGPRPSHYGLVIVSALVGAAISARQVLLHIVPGSGAYGDPILGLHFYTWALILFLVIVLGAALMLLFDRQFEALDDDLSMLRNGAAGLGLLGGVAIALALLMAAGNGVSTVLECAGGLCPDDPQTYILLGDPLPAPGAE